MIFAGMLSAVVYLDIMLLMQLIVILLQHGFKMFLGITPVVTNWSPAGDEFSLLIENNPLIDFVELPEGHNRLNYSNILCGALRGALEMVGICCCHFVLNFTTYLSVFLC